MAQEGSAPYRVTFYNTENLFDTFDDPAIEDDEFTPEGELHWTFSRYWKMLNNIARVITAVGEWEPPALIGLCEVENFQVLMDLTTKTPLKSTGYGVIHENSPDRRGIDAALLYRPEIFSLITHRLIPVGVGNSWSTRDMLLATFKTGPDTLHVIVCHWPSRSGGEAFSAGRRAEAAGILRQATDSLQHSYNNPKILIMGDFNDEPSDESLSHVLATEKLVENPESADLYNLSYRANGDGTLVHTEINKTWLMFDQIIVSGALIKSDGLSVQHLQTVIFRPDWLIRSGRPFRTYQGPRYLGGNLYL